MTPGAMLAVPLNDAVAVLARLVRMVLAVARLDAVLALVAVVAVAALPVMLQLRLSAQVPSPRRGLSCLPAAAGGTSPAVPAVVAVAPTYPGTTCAGWT